MNSEELLSNKKALADAQALYRDLAAGDPYSLKRFEEMNLDMKAIKTALDFLMNSKDLNDAQKIDLLQNNWRVNYREKPPTPEEFLTEKYLGLTAPTLYPYIKDLFIQFMDPTSEKRNLILYPFTGFGKSFLSTIIVLYITTCCSLMRNPYKYLGLSPATVLCQMLVSYSLKKSRELLVRPFENIMESSPFFQKVQRKDTMKEMREEFEHKEHVNCLYYTTADPDSEFLFDSGITVKTTSNPTGLIGLSIISCVMSELAFFTDAGRSSDFVMRTYTDSRGRVYTRMKGNYFGRTILDSSPNSLTNAIDNYIVNEAPLDKSNMIVKGALWEWRPDEKGANCNLSYGEQIERGEIFKIYTGGKGQPPKILEDNDPLLTNPQIDQAKIINVPLSLKQIFQDNLVKTLKDFAGIPSGVADSIITDFTVIEDMFDNNLRNIYTNIYAPATDNPQQLIWNQVRDLFFRHRADKYEFYYLPHIARCISVDQSEVTDITAISMGHVERSPEADTLVYVIDFTITILPTPARINLEAIGCFIKDLRDLGNINIAKVSFDNFQSAPIIQNLRRDGIETEKLSVDRTTGPYLNLISLLNQKRIHAGKNIFLKNNLKSLHVKSTKDHIKIDHDSSNPQVTTGDESWDKSFIGYYGKDCSDSVAAVVELCTKEFPIAQVNWGAEKITSNESGSLEEKEAVKKKLNTFLASF